MKKMKKQKKILKSIFPMQEFPYLFFIIGCLFFVFSLIIWILFILAQNNMAQIINELIAIAFIGFLFIFLSLIRLFLPHVIIYEDGVKVRKSFTFATMLSYLIPRFYHFKQIKSIDIEKFNVGKTRVDQTLNIQLENDVYNISINWLKNHEAVLKELNQRFLIYKNLHSSIYTTENVQLITIIKNERKSYPLGRNKPFYTFREHGKVNLRCNERGNDIEPIVLDSSIPLPNRITIKDNELNVHINNISFAKLGFLNSKNVVVKNCTIDLLRMKDCSRITFINCMMTRDLKFMECQEIKFENCIIKRIVLFKSANITLDHCYINKLKDWMSKNNQFISTSIKSLKTNVKESTFNSRNTINQTQIKKIKFNSRKLRPAGPNILQRSLYVFTPIAIVLIVLDQIMGSVMILIYILIFLLGIEEIITEYNFKLKYKYIERKKDKYGINQIEGNK